MIIDTARAFDGHVIRREAVLRLRDRRPFLVRFEACRESISGSADARLRWQLASPSSGH